MKGYIFVSTSSELVSCIFLIFSIIIIMKLTTINAGGCSSIMINGIKCYFSAANSAAKAMGIPTLNEHPAFKSVPHEYTWVYETLEDVIMEIEGASVFPQDVDTNLWYWYQDYTKTLTIPKGTLVCDSNIWGESKIHWEMFFIGEPYVVFPTPSRG